MNPPTAVADLIDLDAGDQDLATAADEAVREHRGDQHDLVRAVAGQDHIDPALEPGGAEQGVAIRLITAKRSSSR